MANKPKTAKQQPPSAALRLLAFDEDDIAVISAHLQDAIIRVGDIGFVPSEGRFALVTSRFDWSAAIDGALRRRLSGLHFDHVRAVQKSGFDQGNRDIVLNLLGILFETGDAPSGTITLTFSAGAAIRLEVECIDAQLNDLGPDWRARIKPEHDLPGGDLPDNNAGTN